MVHDSFQRLARVIGSRIIISHIRCPKAGHQQESQAQPLTDHFLDHHWLFSFTGEARGGHELRQPPAPDAGASPGRPGLRVRPGRGGSTTGGLAGSTASTRGWR